jgi:hypothetical protein
VNKENCCDYCYAKRLFKNDKFAFKAKKVKEKIFRDLKDHIPEFSTLRIGKNFECGSKNTRVELLQVLELCVRYNVRPILVSKVLDFDTRVADLVIKANGTIHISLGDDNLEKGAVAQGATFEERVEVASKYKEYGVNCCVRVVCDITMPMPERVKKVKDREIRILLTPLYYLSKAIFEENRKDLTWDEAISSGTYYWKSGLHPNLVHDDWKSIKDKCGKIGGKMNCNNCGLGKIRYSEEIGYNKSKYKQKLVELGWNLNLEEKK